MANTKKNAPSYKIEINTPNQKHKKIVTFLSLGTFILISYIILGATGLLIGEAYETVGKICVLLAMLYGGYGMYLMSQTKDS